MTQSTRQYEGLRCASGLVIPALEMSRSAAKMRAQARRSGEWCLEGGGGDVGLFVGRGLRTAYQLIRFSWELCRALAGVVVWHGLQGGAW